MKDDLDQENLDTLQKFGSSFQTKSLAVLLKDIRFLEQIYDIIVPHYFESDANKWIAEKILWYYENFKNLPTLDVFKQEIDKIPAGQTNDTLKVSIIAQLKNVHTQVSAADLDYIKAEFLTFCQNQAVKNAVLKSADLLKVGKYPEIKVIVDRALRAGQERNIGHNWQEDFEVRVSKVARVTIPTPWPVINHLIDGGLGPGELGCVIAPSGIGKSWFLRAIGAEALRRGLRVVDYTFELSENYVGLRYDTIITGIEPSKIKDNVAHVRSEIDKINGELFIKYYPTRAASVIHLMAHINRMTQMGYKPDMVVVDYADLMRSTEKSNARHEELGFIYEELRGMVGELQIPCWTASQSQRSALQDEVVEADKIAGAYSKIFVSDVVLSVSRKLSDKISDTARVHMIKNRFGADGMTFPSVMNLSHGQIEIYDESSVDGIRIKNQMANGTGKIQDMLKKRLLDIGKTQQILDGDDLKSIDLD